MSMRTYSGFLLLQDILDFLPNTDPTMTNFNDFVTRPRVPVVQTDCLTQVGTVASTNYELEGETELATDLPLTKARLDFLLSQGIYTVAVRDGHSCVSPGGICSKCYHGTYIDQGFPPLNSVAVMDDEYNYQTDVITTDGVQMSFPLTQDPSQYTKALVIMNGVILMSGYTIVGKIITMGSTPPFGAHIVVRYSNNTTIPFMGYLSNTYSGSLLGMKPLPTATLHLRNSTFQNILNDSQLGFVRTQLDLYKLIPGIYLDYINTIQDKLEKSLYMLVLYGVFASSTT